MKAATLLKSLIPLLLLSACSSPQIQYVTKIEYRTIDIPDSMYPKCEQVESPDLTYGGAINLVGELRGEIEKCNSMSDSLKNYIEKTKAEIEKN